MPTLANRGRRTGRGAMRMTLVRGPRPFQVGLVSNLRVRAKSRTRVRIRLTVPGDAPAGGYRLRTCVRPYGSVAVALQAKPPADRHGGAAPEPTATPTASPTAAPTATPAPPPAVQVREAVTVDGMFAHLSAFQGIADANGGDRSAGTPGYDASLAYVKAKLEEAGYQTTTQTFDFVAYEENAPSLLERTASGPTSTIESQTLDYSPSGDVTGEIQTATPDFTPPRAGDDGCEDEDFDGKTFTARSRSSSAAPATWSTRPSTPRRPARSA